MLNGDFKFRIVADRSRSGSFSQDKSSILRDFLTSKMMIISPISIFLISCSVLALSTHAVFEGLAAGLEHHTEDVWTMFGAIAKTTGLDKRPSSLSRDGANVAQQRRVKTFDIDATVVSNDQFKKFVRGMINLKT